MAGLQADNDILAGVAGAEKNQLKDLDRTSAFNEKSISHEANESSEEGVEFPTEEEIATLRRVSDAIPWTAYCKMILQPYQLNMY